MQTASLGKVLFSMLALLILASKQVLLMTLILPLALNPQGLTVMFNFVEVIPILSYEMNLAGFQFVLI